MGVWRGSPVMSRYRSSCCSRRCSSCGVELRLFFTPGEEDELRREQGGAVAQAERRSLLRFMEAAAARQGTATMARQPGLGPRAASPAARDPGGPQRWPVQSARSLGRCCRGVRAQRAAVPGDPQDGCSVELHSQKEGPTTLLRAYRLGPLIGQCGVTSRNWSLPTGRYSVTP